VALRTPGNIKENVILSIGRFFGEESGHCKQQLQLVRAFRRLLDDGLAGWRLVLVGGADKAYRDYALAVRREAHGLPIDVLLNADFGTLNDELARASIYWHATGLGMDLSRYPERAEHFGIAPVEAMSAGAIPVLFNAGGLAEIVRPGKDGFLYSSIEELVSVTRMIVDMPKVERENYRASAIARAQTFSKQRFADELSAHIHEIVGSRDVS
jgi:glycosyltransferase involved in cell wall biosynthesis